MDIRFRAWIPSSKEMIEIGVLELDSKVGHDYYNFWDHYAGTTAYFDPQRGEDQRSILMQFIGLFDRQGIEMYVGDIVRTPAGLSVIEFDKGLFGLNHDYGTDKKTMLGSWGTKTNLRCLHDGYNDECIVVGDIYRNPELLNTSAS